MPKVRIEVFEAGKRSATINVPIWVVTGASRLLPRISGKRLEDHVDLDAIRALIADPAARGKLLEIEDHEDQDRIVISLVGDDDLSPVE